MDDIDKALFNTFRVRFRLGEFDPEEGNPYTSIGEESMMTEKAKELSLRKLQENKWYCSKTTKAPSRWTKQELVKWL